MKKTASFGLAMTYTGSFLGAGYVSGQELWQYFGRFGLFGLFGLLITMSLFVFLGYALYVIVAKTNFYQMDRVVVLNGNKTLLSLVSVLQILNFISLYVIMIAGISALFETVFNISEYITAVVSVVICFALAIRGVKGLIQVFSFAIPVLTVIAVVISVASVFYGEFNSDIVFEPRYKYLWIFGCLVYMSFNFFGVIGIMAPVYAQQKDKKTVKLGLILGVLTLFLIAVSILTALNTNIKYTEFELPMLNLSFDINKTMGTVYSVLLFIAMMGTALSSVVAIDAFLSQKIKTYNSKRLLFLTFLTVICYLFSLFGFGELISFIYPVFGITGFFAIILLVRNFLIVRKQKNPS